MRRTYRKLRVGVAPLLVALAVLVTISLIAQFARSGQNLPPEKQTIEDRYSQERAEGQLNPASKLGDASKPPPSPPAPRLAPGIINSGDAALPKPYFALNQWRDYDSNGNLVWVYAGGSRTEEEGLTIEGRLIVVTDPATDDPEVVQHFLTPINGGPVRITVTRSFNLGLRAKSGASFVFDVASSTFTKSVATPDTVAPTCAQPTIDVTASGQATIKTSVQDALSGLAYISTSTLDNAALIDPQFDLGTNDPVLVYVRQGNRKAFTRFAIVASDIAQNRATCAPVIMPVINIKPEQLPGGAFKKSKGTFAVVIFSTKNFNAATEIDRSSLAFGKTGSEHSLVFCNNSSEDDSHDRHTDLVCHFRSAMAGFTAATTTAILSGKTLNGAAIFGVDVFRTDEAEDRN